MQRAPLAMRGSLSRRWLMLKRANTDAKARTSARVRAVARPATTVPKARTPAKTKGAAAPREAHRPALQRQALPHQALHFGNFFRLLTCRYRGHLRCLVVSSQSKRDRLAKLVIARPEKSS